LGFDNYSNISVGIDCQ